jgi:excisionase family DNA binding protein
MGAARLATKKAKKGAVDMSDLISQSEAARLRGVSRNAIGYLVRQGRLSTTEVGGRTFVYRSEVEAFKPGKPGPKAKGRER